MRENKVFYTSMSLLFIFLFFSAWPANVLAQIQRVSVSGVGAEGDRGSYQASISDDGRIIAFRSNATNLVAGDTNNVSDVFVHDTQTGATERVSIESDGTEFNDGSFAPSISDDGRYVALQSYRGSDYGGYGYAKILVYDRQTGTSTEVLPIPFIGDPVDREARQEPSLSGDGRYVAFHSLINKCTTVPASMCPPDDDLFADHDIFVYDLQNQTTERVSRDSSGVEGNGDSYSAALSDNGNFVAFYSYANNLVSGDTNSAEDVFVKDRSTGATTRVSIASDGTEGNDDSYRPSISGDGRYVAFRSLATNLVVGDTNASWDIFVHDRQTGVTQRVSVATGGTQANNHSYEPSISDDGRYVTFRSAANNLVTGDTNNRWDIFLRDRQLGTTVRINPGVSGSEADNHSYEPAISGNGNFITFESDATNLVTSDTNTSKDIFLIPR